VFNARLLSSGPYAKLGLGMRLIDRPEYSISVECGLTYQYTNFEVVRLNSESFSGSHQFIKPHIIFAFSFF
jgi:hypothetical protein